MYTVIGLSAGDFVWHAIFYCCDAILASRDQLTTKAHCMPYSGPLLYISIDCPRGEALLLTSPVASNSIIRIVDDAVKQHKGQLVCGQNRNV